MTKMHICFLIATNEPHAYWWTRYFIERGHKVSVITYWEKRIPGADNYFISTPFRGGMKYIATAKEVRNIIKKLNPDILHAHYITSQGFLAYNSNFHPQMLSVWGSDVALAPQKNPLFKNVIKRVLENADCVNSPAEHITEKIEKITSNIKRIETYQYGVDTDYMETIRPKKKNEKYRIISSRNFKPLYNIDTVLQAVSYVRNAVTDFDFVLLGKGTDEQTRAVESCIDQYNMKEYTVFPGFVPMEEVYSYLKSSDIFISIPDTDGTPISLLEAMYCGTYPILSDIEANRELYIDNDNVAISDIDARKVAELIKHSIFAKDMRQNASNINKTLINNKYNWSLNMKRTENIYRELIEKT